MLAAILGTGAAVLVPLLLMWNGNARRAGRIEEGVAGLYRYIDSKFQDHEHRIERLESWQDRTEHPAGRGTR